MTPDMEEAAKMIKQGMEDNSAPSPQLSLDPDSHKISVVGDPNLVQPTNGDYKLTFLYSSDEITEEDKANMKHREDTDEYELTIEYKGKRVKPLHRQKVDLVLADIFEQMGVLDSTGYNTDAVKTTFGEVLMNNIEKLAEVAYLVCGIPKEQVEHLDPYGLAEFLNQLLANEPNILKESVAFLAQRSLQRQGSTNNEAKTSQDTPQS